MECPRCGAPAITMASFCTRCGARLDAPASAEPGAVTVAWSAPNLSSEAPGGAVLAPPTVAVMASAAPRYAGFWRRFWAALVDGVLLWLAGAIVRVGFGLPLFGTLDWNPDSDFAPAALASLGVSAVMAWLYAALQESSASQATLGKRVLGIRVTDLAGRRISFARATGRHFAKLVSGALLLIGYLMVAFTARKQGLHDMIAGCLVVRDPEPGRPAAHDSGAGSG